MAKFRFSTRELGRSIQEAARANGAAAMKAMQDTGPRRSRTADSETPEPVNR